MTRNIRAIDRAALKADLTARLSHLPCPSADDLDLCADRRPLTTMLLLCAAESVRRRMMPWFSGVAEEVRSLKQQRRRAERPVAEDGTASS